MASKQWVSVVVALNDARQQLPRKGLNAARLAGGA
jgi:hypothetical protein